MYMKRFNTQSAIQRTAQGVTESCLGQRQLCKYTNVNTCNCVVRGLLVKTDCFSKSERQFSKKPSSGPQKRYESSICIAVCPSRLLMEADNLAGNSPTLTTPAQPLLRDLTQLFTVQVCVVPLDSSSVFCGCSLTHTATASCSVWTSDHAHFRILPPYKMTEKLPTQELGGKVVSGSISVSLQS